MSPSPSPDRASDAPQVRDTSAHYTIALAGNPNVGKSTVFNALTGLRQHTGNWPGKTVSRAEGTFEHHGHHFNLIDLPGAYSLRASTEDEIVARDEIQSSQYDAIVVVVDAGALERNLALAYQIMAVTPRVLVCVNLIDEAKLRGITVDAEALSAQLGVPVVATAARFGQGIDQLVQSVDELVSGQVAPTPKLGDIDPSDGGDEQIAAVYRRCAQVAEQCTTTQSVRRLGWSGAVDRVVTHPVLGLPLMAGLLGLVFWLTIIGANVPSSFLAGLLHEEGGLSGFWVEHFDAQAPGWLAASLYEHLHALAAWAGTPGWLNSLAIDGVYLTLAWVVSVMLPPMAIFFPMFTFLEDLGYLPRVAFNLDWLFRRFGAHGKQSLTMAMGFGCNAAGVISCRIIDSPRERLIAILTNSFMICNGRFPTVILIAAVCIAPTIGGAASSLVAAGVVFAVVMLGLFFTLGTSLVLSRTALKGEPSSFTLELPQYRRPALLRILYTSLIDRTLFVLLRACAVSIPAGVAIWVMANVHVSGATLGEHVTGALAPLGHLMGLDGAILLAYIIAIPANEIVVPTIVMLYLNSTRMIELDSDSFTAVLDAQGWTLLTAVSLLLFVVLHNPCGTTIYTIWKETRSGKWTAFAALFPVALGIICCIALATIWRIVA